MSLTSGGQFTHCSGWCQSSPESTTGAVVRLASVDNYTDCSKNLALVLYPTRQHLSLAALDRHEVVQCSLLLFRRQLIEQPVALGQLGLVGLGFFDRRLAVTRASTCRLVRQPEVDVAREPLHAHNVVVAARRRLGVARGHPPRLDDLL